VGAGDADKAGEVGFGHAQQLRFFPAHDVGPVGSDLGAPTLIEENHSVGTVIEEATHCGRTS
jgi:hypothetical protein